MATSRYAPVSAAPTSSTTSGNTSSNTTGNSSTTGSSSTQGSSLTQQDSNSTTQSQNMSGQSLAALELLIQQLLGGGTQDQAVQRAQRQGEIATNQASRGDYTKEAAFSDAQGLMAQTMRQTLEKLMPTINRAAAGAGTSQGSMRALLTQKAADEAAQAAAAQGLNAAVQYGGVNAGFSSILERLTQPDNTVTQSLLNALNIARGAVTTSSTEGSQTTATDSSQNTNSQSNTNTNQQTNTNANQTTVTGSAGGRTTGDVQPTELVSFGPTQSAPTGTAGTTIDLLQQLNDLAPSNSWSNGFTF